MLMKVQVTALGNSRAGKTHLLLAMYSTLADITQEGIHVEVKRLVRTQNNESREYIGLDADAILREDYRQVVLNGQWLPGTVDRTLFEFQLLADDQPLVDFTWIDYRGGAIDGTSTDNTDTKQLITDIANSSAIVIVADSYRIKREAPIVAQEATGAARIQRIVSDFVKKHPYKALAVPIVLSKFDVVPTNGVEYDEFKRRCYTLFGNIVSLVEHPKPEQLRYRGAFIPVSIPAKDGASYKESPSQENRFLHILETNLTLPPEPVNVHLPLIYCLAREMQYERERLMREKQALFTAWRKKRDTTLSLDNWWHKYITGMLHEATKEERVALDAYMRHSDEVDKLEMNIGYLLRIAERVQEIDSSCHMLTHYSR